MSLLFVGRVRNDLNSELSVRFPFSPPTSTPHPPSFPFGINFYRSVSAPYVFRRANLLTSLLLFRLEREKKQASLLDLVLLLPSPLRPPRRPYKPLATRHSLGPNLHLYRFSSPLHSLAPSHLCPTWLRRRIPVHLLWLVLLLRPLLTRHRPLGCLPFPRH